LRVGGSYRYVWTKPPAHVLGMRGSFLEVIVPARVVQTEQFDEPWYPGEAVGTLELSELSADTTRLTLTVAYESEQAREMVLKSGMEGGLAMIYNRLAEILPALLSEHKW
jgi:uncharacterized protein YndB with AHSA1/START domain